MHLYVVPQEIDSIYILTRNCRFYCCFGQILCWTSSISCKILVLPELANFSEGELLAQQQMKAS